MNLNLKIINKTINNDRICLIGLILCLFLVGETYSARAHPTVTINKCCHIGEHMDKTEQCVAGSSEKWFPQVYLLLRKEKFTPVGEAPRHFQIIEKSVPKTCNKYEYFTGDNNIIILSNGTLYLGEKSINVLSEDYCVDKDSALVCLKNENDDMGSLLAPKKTSKIKKCCGPNAVYNQENATCVFLDREHELFNQDIITLPNVEVTYGLPVCKINSFAIAGKYKDGSIHEPNGSIVLESGKMFSWNEYCLEHTVTGDRTVISVFACPEHFEAPESNRIPTHDVRFALYSVGLLISVIFLLATLATGFLVPSNHHVLHWRCQTHYVACLLVGDLLLAITQIGGPAIIGPTCVTMAIMMHFFFLAAFFWLNTMCFNIWWTFRDFRPTSMEKGQEICRLRIYQVYAWGVPLLIAGLAAILDNLPKSPEDTFLRPRFGENKCWFFGDTEIFIYFFGPIGFLLCVNLLLFASTARQLTCGLWKRDDVKSTTERAALGRVCLKLVVVMGVTWGADVISWIIGGPQYIWYVTDLINALQGVLIFIVVGCQPQVWSAMKRMWNSKTGRNVTNTTHGPQHSSSSHGLPSMGESVTNNTFTSNKTPMETVC